MYRYTQVNICNILVRDDAKYQQCLLKEQKKISYQTCEKPQDCPCISADGCSVFIHSLGSVNGTQTEQLG